MQVQVNGITSYSNVNFDKTLYASPYLVMDEHEYTKHYYIEGERVCSKIGGGFGPADVLPTSTPLNFIVGDETDCSENLFALTKRFVLCTGYSGNWEISHTLQPAYNTEHNFEDKQYFYHPDHLGSSSFITNALGRAEQHLQYLPFGELWINQRTSEFDSPYKFSAKELDNESGYNYFGARYYDSEASIWLSVDPMASQFSSQSPYNYCFNNPVRLVDPDGLAPDNPPWVYGQLYANSISSGRLQSSDVKKNLVGAAAILATPLVIYSIPAIIYGLSTGAASGAAMFASNPETAIGLMGLTMSILDPSPVHDYPGGFDDILRGAKILVKNKGVQRFIFRTGRFKYMFGKGTGSSNNVKRSLDNLSALEKMGITDNQAGRQKLLGYFDKAMDSETTNLHLNPNNGKWEGWKVVDVVEDGVYKGKLQVGVSYADEMMKSTPEVTTIIPMPSKK